VAIRQSFHRIQTEYGLEYPYLQGYLIVFWIKKVNFRNDRENHMRAEFFSRYQASDYRGVLEEYERNKAQRRMPLARFPWIHSPASLHIILCMQQNRLSKPLL
jgi:hypothetical protein